MASESIKLQPFRYSSAGSKFCPEATAHLSDSEFARYVSFINFMFSYFEPEGPGEETLARTIAESMYRLDGMHDIEMLLRCTELDTATLAANPLLRQFLRSKNPLRALNQYESRLWRQHDSANRRLTELQLTRRRLRLSS